MPLRPLKWLAATLAALMALVLLPLLWLVLFGWNWARGPLEDLALRKTGRALQIRGDLGVTLAWPTPLVRAQRVSYANPAWATDAQMLDAEAVEVSLDLPALLRGRLEFPELRLTKPRVFLEQASGGRKSWLLDRAQTDEEKRILIGRVLLDQGAVTYLDAAQHTAIHVALSTTDRAAMSTGATAGAAGNAPEGQPGRAANHTPGASAASEATAASGASAANAVAQRIEHGVVFTATGQFHAEPLVAQGSGGAVVRWRDESMPYPLRIQATIGRTNVSAEGSVTGLRQLKALDLQLALEGDSLSTLFPLIGMALPPTPAYRTAGHLLHTGALWRYESLAARVGQSDFAGTLQVDIGEPRHPRPVLSGTLTSRRLDLADLGPAVGAKKRAPGTAARPDDARRAAAGTARPPGRVLPDMPLDTARWASLDADVSLQAQTLVRPQALPLDGLQMRLRLEDRRLVLDPIGFDLAGGRLLAQVTLDGRAEPMQGRAKVQLRGLRLARLLPSVDLSRASIGQLNGDAELTGQGASLGGMLATSNGRLSLVAQDGEISRLLMEQVGLHLLEILRLNLSGDQRVHVNCAVADFSVARGVMQARALVLDTSVNTLVGSGSIDLAHETLDLTFNPRTKVASLLALRSPFYVKGPFSNPVVELDTGRMAARGAGALALGLLNPLLALIPLFEAGPGVESPCAALVRAAQTATPKAPS
jgi:AsmA protein